jgi:hypothetical protein
MGFRERREYTAQVKNLRCRLAGYAYMVRFEWMLNTIERDAYCLRSDYPERKSLQTGIWIGWSMLTSMFVYLHMRDFRSLNDFGSPGIPEEGSTRCRSIYSGRHRA